MPVASIAAGLVIGAVFIQRQRTLADPLIDLRLFRVPAFSASLATYTFGIFAGFGTFLFIAQYLQLVLGLSPLEAGMWSAPGSVAFVIGSNLAPRIVRRIQPALVVAGGLLLAAIGFFLVTQIGLDSLMLVVVGNVLMSVGFGFAFTLTVDLVIAAAPPERAGAASALSETGAEFGGALGLAVLGSLGLAVYRTQLAATLPAGIAPEIAHTAEETLSGAVTAAAQLPGALGADLLGAARQAFVHALQLNAVIGVVGFVGLAILVGTMLRHVRPHGEAEEEREVEHTVQPVRSWSQPEVQIGD